MEENMHMQLVDECNVEGATVSDDEGTNRNQVLCDIQKLSDDESVQTSKRWWLFSLLGVQGRHYDDVCKAPSETLSIEKNHPG